MDEGVRRVPVGGSEVVGTQLVGQCAVKEGRGRYLVVFSKGHVLRCDGIGWVR